MFKCLCLTFFIFLAVVTFIVVGVVVGVVVGRVVGTVCVGVVVINVGMGVAAGSNACARLALLSSEKLSGVFGVVFDGSSTSPLYSADWSSSSNMD